MGKNTKSSPTKKRQKPQVSSSPKKDDNDFEEGDEGDIEQRLSMQTAEFLNTQYIPTNPQLNEENNLKVKLGGHTSGGTHEEIKEEDEEHEDDEFSDKKKQIENSVVLDEHLQVENKPQARHSDKSYGGGGRNSSRDLGKSSHSQNRPMSGSKNQQNLNKSSHSNTSQNKTAGYAGMYSNILNPFKNGPKRPLSSNRKTNNENKNNSVIGISSTNANTNPSNSHLNSKTEIAMKPPIAFGASTKNTPSKTVKGVYNRPSSASHHTSGSTSSSNHKTVQQSGIGGILGLPNMQKGSFKKPPISGAPTRHDIARQRSNRNLIVGNKGIEKSTKIIGHNNTHKDHSSVSGNKQADDKNVETFEKSVSSFLNMTKNIGSTSYKGTSNRLY